MLLALPARDATTAAVKAANESPFNPVGNKFNSTGYARSGLISPPASMSCWNIPFFQRTKAAIPGSTTMTGIKSFRKAAKSNPVRAVGKSAPRARCVIY